jgi:hypothetical protein
MAEAVEKLLLQDRWRNKWTAIDRAMNIYCIT